MEIREEYGQYRSRDFPFSAGQISTWADLLPAEDTKGLTCTISDAGRGNGRYPTATAGQYIVSRARRIQSDNPEGLIRIFTLPVRYLKEGPVYTTSHDCRSWIEEEMAELRLEVMFTLYHEVGHYVHHRAVGPHNPGLACEAAADNYAHEMMEKARRVLDEKEVA